MCWVQKSLAELKKGTEEVNPDEESRQRLRVLRGEAAPAAAARKAKPAFRTAQVLPHQSTPTSNTCRIPCLGSGEYTQTLIKGIVGMLLNGLQQ